MKGSTSAAAIKPICALAALALALAFAIGTTNQALAAQDDGSLVAEGLSVAAQDDESDDEKGDGAEGINPDESFTMRSGVL